MIRFQLGKLSATTGALRAISGERIAECLRRHASGDWGAVDAHDKAVNDRALREGARLLSAYPIDPSKPETVFWIITEADRSVTTFLLPTEY